MVAAEFESRKMFRWEERIIKWTSANDQESDKNKHVGIFRTLWNIYDEASCENSYENCQRLKFVNYFRKMPHIRYLQSSGHASESSSHLFAKEISGLFS